MRHTPLLSIAVLASALWLGGCAIPITSDVKSFQSWPADAPGGSYAFASVPTAAGEIEQQVYQALAMPELERIGLKPAADGTRPRFVVELHAVITPMAHTVPAPAFGPYPMGLTARVNRRGYPVVGSTLVGPYNVWGPSGFGGWVTRADPYPRLALVIRDQSRLVTDGRVPAVFEAVAMLDMPSTDLSAAMPYLVRSVFEGFPGTNGQQRSVRFEPKSPGPGPASAPLPAAPAAAPVKP